MPEDLVCLGFDFGYKRIGVAVGQRLTCTASPLETLSAREGIPDWAIISRLIKEWRPKVLVIGLPTCIDDKELYTTEAARSFARQLENRFSLPVRLVDERLSTIEARQRLFEKGGYRKIHKSQVDSLAACIILEQWLQSPDEVL